MSLDDLIDEINPLQTPKPMGNKPSSLNALQAHSGKEMHTLYTIIALYLISLMWVQGA